MAIAPVRVLAYLPDPKVKDSDLELTSNEIEAVLEYAKTMFPKNNLLPFDFDILCKTFLKTSILTM